MTATTLTVEEFLAARLAEDLLGAAMMPPHPVFVDRVIDRAHILADIAIKQGVLARLASLTAEKRERWEDYSGWVGGRASAPRVWKYSDQELDEIPALTRLVRSWAAMYREHPEYDERWAA